MAHATAWSRFVEVERRLSEYTAPGSKGQETSAPLFGVWKALHERVCATSAALGLHVTARARLPEVPPVKQHDSAWDELDRLGV